MMECPLLCQGGVGVFACFCSMQEDCWRFFCNLDFGCKPDKSLMWGSVALPAAATIVVVTGAAGEVEALTAEAECIYNNGA